MLKHVLFLAAALLMPAAALAQSKTGNGKYADIGNLKLYYQLHGQAQPQSKSRPLLVLHGGFMTIEAMGPILPALAQGRQVIAVDLEGHGRTVDLDRPLNLDQMAADVAAFLKQLGVEKADVLGFSMGGGVALRIAAAEPQLVAKLVVISVHHKMDAYYPSIRAMWPGMTVQGFTGTPMEKAYLETAPDPKRWPAFVEKMKPHAALAAENGLTLGIENHVNNLIDTPDSLRWLADDIRTIPGIGIAFAPYHLPQESLLLAELIEQLGPKIAVFYAWQHGVGCMQAQPRAQEMLQMPGRGSLDFYPMIQSLAKINYSGWTEIFMHPTPRGIPILPTAAETTAEIIRAKNHLDNLVTNL